MPYDIPDDVFRAADGLAGVVLPFRCDSLQAFDALCIKTLLESKYVLRAAVKNCPGSSLPALARLTATSRDFREFVHLVQRRLFCLYAAQQAKEGDSAVDWDFLEPDTILRDVKTGTKFGPYSTALMMAFQERWADKRENVLQELEELQRDPPRRIDPPLLRHVLAPARFAPPRPPAWAAIETGRRRTRFQRTPSRLCELVEASDIESSDSETDMSGYETTLTTPSSQSSPLLDAKPFLPSSLSAYDLSSL